VSTPTFPAQPPSQSSDQPPFNSINSIKQHQPSHHSVGTQQWIWERTEDAVLAVVQSLAQRNIKLKKRNFSDTTILTTISVTS